MSPSMCTGIAVDGDVNGSGDCANIRLIKRRGKVKNLEDEITSECYPPLDQNSHSMLHLKVVCT